MNQKYSVTEAIRALSEPTRMKIVEELSRCDCGPDDCTPENSPSIGDVCCAVDGSEEISSTMSRHIKKLRDVGLIQTTKQGRVICCSLNRELLKECSNYLAGLANTAAP